WPRPSSSAGVSSAATGSLWLWATTSSTATGCRSISSGPPIARPARRSSPTGCAIPSATESSSSGPTAGRPGPRKSPSSRGRAADRPADEGQRVRAVFIAPGRVRAIRSEPPMDFTPAAKRAFQTQSYGPAPSIEGVEIVELKRFADDGGSMTELARLTTGHPQAFKSFEVRQINYSEVEPGVIKAFLL